MRNFLTILNLKVIQIQLVTGKTISVSYYEWLFLLKEEDVEEFFQSCIADDIGVEINNPFSNKVSHGKLEVEEIMDIEDDIIED